MNWTNIDGWCDFGWLYERVVNRYQTGSTFVETGTWKGKSSCCMGELIRSSGKKIKFFTIDTFVGEGGEPTYDADSVLQKEKTLLPEFLRNRDMCGVSDYVDYIQSDAVSASALMEDGSVEFIFLDSSHQEDHVYRELISWYPKLKVGGTMAGHDQHHPPIQSALRRFCSEKGIHYHSEGSCWILDIPNKQ